METDKHAFLQVIRIPNGELWHSRDSEMVFSTEGDIQVLHSKSLNQFILRFQDFKVLLDKSVQIISSIVGRHQRQAFILPRGIGFSMIRLADSKSTPALQNFETILENTTSFSHKSNIDPVLASFKETREAGLTGSILKTFDAVSKVFAPSADNDSHPNQRIARSFDELLDIEHHGTSVIDISDSDLSLLQKKNELDNAGFQSGEVWKKFTGEAGSFSGQSEPREGHQRTSDMDQPAPKSEEKSDESSMKDQNIQTVRYHASIDHQEVVGAQEQRLPSYEVQHSKEHVERGFRKASVNMHGGEAPKEVEGEKFEENVELPEPEHFDDEAFTFGLLTKDYKQAGQISDQIAPVSSDDAFTDLTHPMRKFSSVDRPFLNIDEEESVKTDKQSKTGFTGQPIITAKGQPTLKSNIDDQPSPISSTEKYTTETSQPESSEQSTDAQPIKLSSFGQQNIIRESSQGNETKKHKKISSEPVDKENVRSTTA